MLYSSLVSLWIVLLQVPRRCRGHMAFWNPCMYGANDGAPYDAAWPLSNDPDWFFHGFQDDEPQEVCELPAGGTFTLEIACNKRFTSYGSDTTDPNDPLAACPDDEGSYHATRNGDQWTDLLGCALSIADSNDVDSVAPEDFIVFSVNQYCVTSRETPFEVPQAMPSCSHDWCLCAWTWAGQDSANEMYQIGFKCKPTGVGEGVQLLPAGEQNARNPWYWANIGHQNVDMDTVGWENKPSYLDRDDFSDGGQEGITTDGGGGQQSPTDDEDESGSTSDRGGAPENPYNEEKERTGPSDDGFTDTEDQPDWQQKNAGDVEHGSQDESSYLWKGKSNASCRHKQRRRRRSLY